MSKVVSKTRTKFRPKPAPKVEWEPKNENQKKLRDSIKSNLVTVGCGPAGVGKSHAALYTAVDALNSGTVNEIIVSRAMIGVGEGLGFLPGSLQEKTDPYLEAILDILYNHPQGQHLLDTENPPVRCLPISLMRGVTFSGIVIIDEAQNCDRSMLKTILTRVGENSKLVLLGDMSQIDIRPERSGFAEAISMFKNDPDVGYVEFTIDDMCRSDFVGRVIKAYYEADQSKKNLTNR